MKESPNKDSPQFDVEFIVEELLNMFNEADGYPDKRMQLNSCAGSTFHARVLNAATHLGLLTPGQS